MPVRMVGMILGIVALLGAGAAPALALDAEAAHAEVVELMARLPAPPPAEPVTVDPPRGDTPMAEGVAITPGERVVLDGTVLFDQGPLDGLEVLACLHGGKKHESLALLTTGNAQLVKAAFIAALDLGRDGLPAQEMSAVPARGIPVGVYAVWQPDRFLEPDRWVRLPASPLVRYRHTDQPFAPLPWIWTGSEFQVIEQDVPGKGLVRRERFMLEVTRSVAVNFDEPHALFASPFPVAAEDLAFEVHSKVAPREGSPIKLVFTPCELPLTLELDAAGELRHEGAVLDDVTLTALLAEIYAGAPEWYAVGVRAQVPGPQGAGVSDQAVVDARTRLARPRSRAVRRVSLACPQHPRSGRRCARPGRRPVGGEARRRCREAARRALYYERSHTGSPAHAHTQVQVRPGLASTERFTQNRYRRFPAARGGGGRGGVMITLEELLRIMVERGGSDLHIAAGSPPRIRTDGALVEIPQSDVLAPEDTQKLMYSILDGEQIARFEQEYEMDMSFGVSGLGRFRVNVFFQRGAVGAVLRIIPYEVKTFEQLGLPIQVCQRICNLRKGLILVTGATGSGKSTSLASMIDNINASRQDHIVTIEDPIEFVHRNKSCLVNQREVGSDTHGFKEALRRVLRQDPDLVLIGEMRGKETIEAGLTLAETGHLTFATLHTSNCVQTINRIVDVFPAYQQNQIRTQLSFVLEGVFCQQLIPTQQGGRALCAEGMVPNSAIRSLIREDKCHQIISHIQTGSKYGSCTMNQSLFELYKRSVINWDDAQRYTTDPEDLKRTFQKDVA